MSIWMVLALQYLVTLLSSGFNACYFWGYRSPHPRRRVAAAVMALVSLATFLESLYFVFLSLQGLALPRIAYPGYWLASRLLVCLGSLAITLLILRQWLNGR